ncbi:MAG TPA: alpha-L-rhamnosidase C-terminal domain-containing protein [Bryobacteraceae bacterium]|nr:alpha-L-rhamnosidase C-terminal domain-containing protein [Bryobacteraceae bacterium]
MPKAPLNKGSAAVLFALLTPVSAATNPELLTHVWTAQWISVPHTSGFDYGVYHFRRTFELASKPSSFVVHVTADNRYQLYVNGDRVSVGPARGDLYHWRYETVDLAPHLKSGRNVLAAVVWNYSSSAPEAQITNETGFLLQGDGAAERVVNTGKLWKGIADEAFSAAPIPREELEEYFAVGPGDKIDGAKYPWAWEQPNFDDSHWLSVMVGPPGAPRDAQDAPSRWMLEPRKIPAMEETPLRLAKVRQAVGIHPPEEFPAKSGHLEIPAHTKARLLLDQTYLTTAYPELRVSQGKGSTVSLRYAEALFLPNKRDKGNRNEIEGKQFRGYGDVFLPDGGAHRLFRPLYWRTYRYVELNIETAAEPLIIEDLRGVYTGYPFERKSRFEGGPEELQKILDVGWHTARLCAHETYMDCPYYEQLQYVGDTRVQSLVSLYTAGDARLMRNAIELIDSSRTAEGATYSRAPSRLQQYIPPFSLWWIGMVHDYWMYQDDPAFVRRMLPGVRAVLDFFAARQKENGSLRRVPWWNFIDWTKEWTDGVPPTPAEGSSAPLDLQLLLAYRWAAEMEEALGSEAVAEDDRDAEDQLRDAVRTLYWSNERKLFADTPAGNRFSQHSNVLAILADVSTGAEAKDLVERIIADKSLVQCSIYFRHYLHSALNKAGAGDSYLDLLGPWRIMLEHGLTTWAETEDPARSDCHAWGASPNYELFRTVLGIDSSAPGFRRVLIRPFLGKLTHAAGVIPHPKGEIRVRLALNGSQLNAEVTLPAGTTGEFDWHGVKKDLIAGSNHLVF